MDRSPLRLFLILVEGSLAEGSIADELQFRVILDSGLTGL